MFRRASSTFIAFAVVAALAPAVAHAAPAGDDFDSATGITSLPFTTTIDTSGAGKAADDPNPCYFWGEGSVWQKYTAQSDGLLRVSARTDTWGRMLAVYTGQRGALDLEPSACVQNGNYTVHAEAGTTYYFMLVERSGSTADTVSFALRETTPEPNDNRAAATVTSVPGDHQADLTRATAEPGEAPPSCAPEATRSVWYRYTPTHTKFVQVGSEQAISVHRADDLSEVDCSTRYSTAVFRATANESYLIRMAASPEATEGFEVSLRTAPDIVPHTSTRPEVPNVLSDTTLGASSGDPIYQPVASGTIDLGDGTVIPVTDGHVTHRFTKDGDYRVTTTVTTPDGRTGTSVRTLKVETHDVSVSGLTVPTSARAGQSKPVKAFVSGTRREDDVTVTFYRVGANGEGDKEIGRLTQRVPVSTTGTTEFPFAYTYRPEDVTAGQVTFRVRAEVAGYGRRGDDKGDDNEARATTASVRPAATVSARIE
ncbi:PKD domain-containing protein [Actinosynnema sp. CA-299493]